MRTRTTDHGRTFANNASCRPRPLTRLHGPRIHNPGGSAVSYRYAQSTISPLPGQVLCSAASSMVSRSGFIHMLVIGMLALVGFIEELKLVITGSLLVLPQV